MAETRLVLATLLRYYRRFPLQALFLVLGLVLGVAMLTGIHAVNEQARASYQKADQAFGRQERFRLEPVQSGGSVPQALYLQLRRNGIDSALPVTEAELRLADGQRLEMIGIDPLALPASGDGTGAAERLNLARFIRPPWPVWMGESQADALGLEDGQMLTLEDGRRIGPLEVIPDEPLLGRRALVDIGAAQALSGRAGELSWISFFDVDSNALEAIELPPDLRLTPMNDPDELDQLTRSFHLNLTAMGLLAFVVGLFIVYNAVSYTVTQRRELIARLRLLGIRRRTLLLALNLELTGWVLLSTLLGFALGLALANLLSPAVADTLDNLYGARVSARLTWNWWWLGEALLMTLAGAAAAAMLNLWRLARTPPTLALGQQAERRAAGRNFLAQALLALPLAGLGLVLALEGESLTAGFGVIACSLLGAALLLPQALLALLAMLTPAVRQRPLAGWATADASARIGRLGVAMMAFLLAMAANVGINTMVGSFRLTFLDWLEQRLSADLYLRPDASPAAPMIDWLEQRPEVERVATLRITRGRAEGMPVEILGMEGPTLRATQVLKQADDGVWDSLAGDGVLISEKLALERRLRIGDRLEFGDTENISSGIVTGITYDYGNPRGQVLLSRERWLALWPGLPPRSLGVYLQPGAGLERGALLQALGLRDSQLIDQASVKGLSLSIFERTFSITRSMNGLTLLVAGLGLFCALLAAESQRFRQFATLRSLGLRRGQLFAGTLSQTAGLVGATGLLSIPLGIGLAWLLINVINVRAFGWTMPLELFPGDYALLLALCLAVALLAAAWPAWRLSGSSCRRWLQEDTG